MPAARLIIAAAVSALLAAPAIAQTTIPLPPGEVPAPKKDLPEVTVHPPKPQAVLEAFTQQVRSLDAIDDRQRAAALERLAEPDRDAIIDALRVLYPPFAEASALLAAEKTDRAAAQFAELFNRADAYLAAYARYFAARAHVMAEDYERARPLLAPLTGQAIDRTLHSGQALFMLGLCHAELLDRDRAIATLAEFRRKYPDASERMTMGAEHLIDRLARIDEGTLGDVEDRMAYARRRLDLGRTADRTQTEQARIIAILDELIAKAEQREQSGGGGAGGAGGGAGGAGGGGGGGSSGGATQSTAPVGPAITGQVHQTHRGRPDEQWGAMPDRQRDEVLNALKTQYPQRYRELVEQYYRSLQEDAP